MSDPNQSNRPAATDTSGARIYDADASTKVNKSGVYDAPARAGGVSMAMIVGIIAALLILAFILFQFVF